MVLSCELATATLLLALIFKLPTCWFSVSLSSDATTSNSNFISVQIFLLGLPESVKGPLRELFCPALGLRDETKSGVRGVREVGGVSLRSAAGALAADAWAAGA